METRTNIFEMGIKQFNGNLMSLHRIASFAYARDISIEIESTAKFNKEHLNHSIVVQKKVKIC